MRFYLDGEIRDAGTAALPPDDRGLTLGDGAFETVAVVAGRARRLPWHLDRLENALRVLGFAPAPDRAALAGAVEAVVAANRMRNGVARLTVTRGSGARGLAMPARPRPRVLVTASDGLPPRKPVHAIVSTCVRRDPRSRLCRIKSLSYLDNVLARMDAEAAGADEALVLNIHGRVAEATTANVFAVLEGVICTPPLSEGCLPGISRRALLAALPVEERAISPDDLARADSVFLTSSVGVGAVLSIDGRPIDAHRDDAALRRARQVIDDPDANAPNTTMT